MATDILDAKKGPRFYEGQEVKIWDKDINGYVDGRVIGVTTEGVEIQWQDLGGIPTEYDHAEISLSGDIVEDLINKKGDQSESAPVSQGEIPEEVEEWIYKYAKSEYTSDDSDIVYRACKALYHKMQEEIVQIKKERDILIGNDKRQENQIEVLKSEIKDYRKFLESLKADSFGDAKYWATILLDKYPHS